jgi:MerR family redox-sensitive transcriptional activator SoxR
MSLSWEGADPIMLTTPIPLPLEAYFKSSGKIDLVPGAEMVMTIGEVARRTGLPTSTIRYYEKLGLLPQPMRSSRQRRYDQAILGRIHVLRAALDAGFTLAEAREFIGGFSADTPPSVRWKRIAAGKMKEMDEQLQRIEHMKVLLQTSFACSCRSLEDCERLLRLAEERRAMT